MAFRWLKETAMVTDRQIRRMSMLVETGMPLRHAAAKAGIDVKTARKYRRLGKRPSEVAGPHTWRTRQDPFDGVWEWCREQLELSPGLRAKTLFEALQRAYPGRFADGQLRTLQRRVKAWRATEGPSKEVFFDQVHRPGALCASDFTDMSSLGVTIQGRRFDHMVYHFVLTYSNWEACTICFSESFEALSEGLQQALWKLGAVPAAHRTDRLTAAVDNLSDRKAFTRRYRALLDHYGMSGQKTQARHPHENGDVEQRHHRFKDAVEQALLLRGSSDFESWAAYEAFLDEVLDRANANRRERLAEELAVMRLLPARRLKTFKERRGIRVRRGSIIHVERNVYSVHSRLIGEKVDVRLYAERLEVWYGQRKVEDLPRVHGRGKSRIDYRHIIDWLVRKPGAFADYRYREELFPTSRFRMAYDFLRDQLPDRAAKEYLAILHLAAHESEAGVDAILGDLLRTDEAITAGAVRRRVTAERRVPPVPEIQVAPVDLACFDGLYDQLDAA
jgi:hypothetical protein